MSDGTLHQHVRQTEEYSTNLRAEYAALTDYYGKVITFRFTTFALFVPAVALFLRSDDDPWYRYLLLFAVTLGIWIVELRNRSIYLAILDRACAIEDEWFGTEGRFNDFSFFRRLIRNRLVDAENKARQGTDRLPLRPHGFDGTQVFLSRRTQWLARFLTHTMGFDIAYVSVMAYAVIRAVATSLPDRPIGGYQFMTQIVVLAIVALWAVVGVVLAIIAYKLLTGGASDTCNRRHRLGAFYVLMSTGVLMIGASARLGWYHAVQPHEQIENREREKGDEENAGNQEESADALDR